HRRSKRQRLAARLLDLRRDPIGCALCEIVDDDARAFAREKQCVLAAETAAGTGNDRNATFDRHLKLPPRNERGALRRLENGRRFSAPCYPCKARKSPRTPRP